MTGSNQDLEESARKIQEEFSDIDLTIDDIVQRLQEYTEHQVPLSEAVDSVQRDLWDEHYDGTAPPDTQSDEVIDIGELSPAMAQEWFTVKGTIVELFDPDDDSIAQHGIIGDSTGTVVFTIWAKSVEQNSSLKVEEGRSYRMESVVCDPYDGNPGLNINANSTLTEIDTAFSPPAHDAEIVAPIVAVQNGSGLIKRCGHESCSRVLQNGQCVDHGVVDGKFDLRIKAVVDDGQEIRYVVFDAEQTAEITGIDLARAVEISQAEFDMEAVTPALKEQVIGRFYRLLIRNVGEYDVVHAVEDIGIDVQTEAQREFDRAIERAQEIRDQTQRQA